MEILVLLLAILGSSFAIPQNAGRIESRDVISRFKQAKTPSLSFQEYLSAAEIREYLFRICSMYPHIASCELVGYSSEGRPINAIRVSNDPLTEKKKILVDAGIHAREWIAPASALFLIYQLVENYEQNRNLINSFDWMIIPLINPDGYEYSKNYDRLWRKNRSNSSSSNCLGVDLNRNFGYRFGGAGTSGNPCSETYRGPYAFSEPESLALRDYARRPENDGILLYLTLHSFGEFFLYPWGYGNELPRDWKDLHDLAEIGAAGINSVFQRKYHVGSSTHLLGAAAGGSDDWMKARHSKYSYTVELPGGGKTGFEMPESRIFNTSLEVYEGIRAMILYLIDEGGRRRGPGT